MNSFNMRPSPLALAAAAILLSFLGVAAAYAQEGEADPFDAAAFDAATSEEAGGGAAGAARTEYLVGGSVLVSAAAYVPAGFDGYAASSQAAGKLFAKVTVPDIGSLFVSYNLSQAFFAALAGNGAAALAPPRSLDSPSYSLGELYYGFDIGKRLFVRVGKQLLAWGPSQVWTPVDFVNRERADAFSSVDLRQGKAGLKLHLPLGKANAFLFTDFSDLISGSTVKDPAESLTVAGRLDATLAGFEFGLSGYAGPAVQAKAGLDFSGNLFGSAVYGEAAWAPADSSHDASLSASLGISRSLGELKRWTVSTEAFYQSLGADHTGDAAAMALLAPLYMGKAYVYAAVIAKELFSPDLSTSLSALANLSDLSWTLRLSEDLSLPGLPTMTLGLACSGGGAGKEFTLAGGDGSWSLSAKTRIEF
jgi:hypothetical protein